MDDHFDHDWDEQEPIPPDLSGEHYQQKRDAMRILEAQNFMCIEKLGSGAFGDVYKMTGFCGQEVAVKIVSLEVIKQNEIEVWPKMSHPNIIPLLQYFSFTNPDVGVFVMPIYRDNLQNAALDGKFLRQSGALDYLKLWLNDSLRGLKYLHSNEACHLDIKADNILISQDYRAVICDFSCLACATKAIPRDDLGLPLMYRPPEACPSFGRGTEVDGKAFDMWAFGMMVLELFTGKALGRAISCAGNWNRDIYPILFNILQEDVFKSFVLGIFSATGIADGQIKIALNFIHTFLMPDRRNRWNAGKAVGHCFFSNGDQIGSGPDQKWLNFCKEESRMLSMHKNRGVKRVADASVKPLQAKKAKH